MSSMKEPGTTRKGLSSRNDVNVSVSWNVASRRHGGVPGTSPTFAALSPRILAFVLPLLAVAVQSHAALLTTWDARDFRTGAHGNATLSDGNSVASWVSTSTSTVSNGGTSPVYEASFTPGGTDAVVFQPADNDRLFSSGTSPIGGLTAFSVVYVLRTFAVGTSVPCGDPSQWYCYTGLVDAEQPGFQSDWGTTIDDGGRVRFGVGNPDTTIFSGNIVDGKWHVVVATWSGSAPGTNQFLWIDGAQVASSGLNHGGARNNATFGFGRQPTEVAGTSNAAFAEVRFYSHALTPAEVTAVTTALVGTHFPCGNGSIEPGEQCDDGNSVAGDCCSPTCQYEPNGNPCTSDGNVCTDDICNATGTCQYVNNTTGCSDPFFCNGADTCGGGTCSVHAGDPCPGPDGDPNCSESCDEATDSCTAADPNGSSCDDGLFCTGADTCSAGTCTVHVGDPCVGGPECDHLCNEAADNCFDSAGTTCTADPNPCTLDQCNGTGACAHPAGNPGALCRAAAGPCDVAETCTGTSTACPVDGFQPNGTGCNDGNACTSLDTCSGGTCQSGAAVDCDDGNACTQDSCVPATGCVNDATPLIGCKSPGKTILVIKDHATDDNKDRVVWKWLKGDSSLMDFGVPTATTEYGLCVFDESANVANPVFDVTVAPVVNWSAAGTSGFNFKDTAATEDGAFRMVLRQGSPDRAKAIFLGKGTALNWTGAPLPLDQDSKVIVQLHNSDGKCWESRFLPAPKKNLTNVFKDVEP